MKSKHVAELSDDDFALYLMYCVIHLSKWKYKSISALAEANNELWKEAPCNINDRGLLLEVVRRYKPSWLGRGKSLEDLRKELEDLFS